MKAVVLMGGYGTRLYPLTYTTPKALLPILNQSFLERSVRWLAHNGISEVIFAVSHLAEAIEAELARIRPETPCRLLTRDEPLPLGSGGALKNCSDLLTSSNEHSDFLLLNGDILTDLDITQLLATHRRSSALVTFSLAEVDDPTHYGIAELNADRVVGWQEKPSREEARSGWANVGVWVMKREILDHIPPGTAVSLERQTFPTLFAQGAPFAGHRHRGYWIDIGTPDKYFQANIDSLLGELSSVSAQGEEQQPGVWVGSGTRLGQDVVFEPPVAVGSECTILDSCRISGPAIIGDGSRLESGSVVERSLLLPETRLGPQATVRGSTVAGAAINRGCTVSAGSLICPGVTVAGGITLPPATVLGPSSRISAGDV